MDKIESVVNAIIKFVEFLKKNSFLQVLKYILQIAFYIMILVGACNIKAVISWVYNVTRDITTVEHDKLTRYRLKINPEVNATLKDMCNEVDATRSFILEFHNGTNNPAGLPFYYMNMTYEYTDIERTYSGASGWGELLISRFNLVSTHFNDGIFVGTVDDVMKVDTNLAYKLKSDDVKYLGCILLYGKNKPIGILGVSTGEDSTVTYEKVKTVLLKYSHKIVHMLDAENLDNN